MARLLLHLLIGTLLMATLAGCAGKEAATSLGAPTSRAPPAPAAPPNVTQELGSISGFILDDEQMPVARATVGIIETADSVESDQSGAYTFNGLEPGEYRLVVTRLGYVETGKKVQVSAGEVTKADIIVTAVKFADPYQLIVPKVAYIKASWIYVTHLVWPRVNNSDMNALVCDPCRFTIHHDPTPQDVMTETNWRSGTTAPVLNNQVWMQHMRNVTASDGDGEPMITGYWSDRETVHWSENQAKLLSGIAQHELWVEGDLLGINFEHVVEVYTSFSYDGFFPEGFTALPPE